MEYEKILKECRKHMGEIPRKMSYFSLWKNKIDIPKWLKDTGDKRFEEIFKHQEGLLIRGQIVWGAIVQANVLLFEKGKHDCPAALIYSHDSRIDKNPDIIKNAAQELFSIKGKHTNDIELQIFADKLADEFVADLELPVPLKLTQGIQCYYTCIMVYRKHLPKRILSWTLLPVLVNNIETKAVMIQPFRYWSEDLIRIW